MIGFALDGIALVFLEPVEDLFRWKDLCRVSSREMPGEQQQQQRRDVNDDDDDQNQTLDRWLGILITPILFSVDNFLAGGAINRIIYTIAAKHQLEPVWIFALCASCTLLGVLAAMLVHFLTQQLASCHGMHFSAELLRIVFLLVRDSFLSFCYAESFRIRIRLVAECCHGSRCAHRW